MPNYPPDPGANPSKPSSEEQQNHQMPLIWKRIVLCVSIVLVVYGAVRLIGYLNDLQRSRQTTQELRETLAEAQTAEPVPQEPGKVTVAPPAEPLLPATETAIPEQQPEERADGSAAAVADKLPAVDYPNGYELNRHGGLSPVALKNDPIGLYTENGNDDILKTENMDDYYVRLNVSCIRRTE